jgi:anti-sigma factor RsiW
MTLEIEERFVGGLRCGEVLEKLSAYLDGEVSPTESAAIEVHLTECDNCARLGGEFSAAVKALRLGLRHTPPEGTPVLPGLRGKF